MKNYRVRWDLQSLLSDKEVEKRAKKLKVAFAKMALEKAINNIKNLEKLASYLKEIESYVECQLVQDVTNQKAKQLKTVMLELGINFETELLRLNNELVALSEKKFSQLIQTKELKELAYFLTSKRAFAKKLAPPNEELLILNLSLDGFHGWSELYSSLIGSEQIEMKNEKKSFAQADNLLSSPNRKVRKEVFQQIQAATDKHKMLYAEILNHIAGFRLAICKKRGWDSPLIEPLHNNNMEKETLDALLEAVNKSKKIFTPAFSKKAELLKLIKLSWYDMEAPFNKNENARSYQELAKFLPEYFKIYSKDAANYCQRALQNGWLDIEERKNKAGGGFCTPFPESKESRIYLSYSGTFHNDLVVAHELGHGYHSHVLFNEPYFAQVYPMSLAEMASTLFEHMAIDGFLQNARSEKERKEILLEKVQRHSIFFMNIPARFNFELELYKKRKEQFLLPDELNKMMLQAEKSAYNNILEEYHPNFWITKMHFYLTQTSFYNFPYAVGYLLSLILFNRAKQNPKEFEKKYISLLSDTGKMSVEDIVRIHFGANAKDSSFWQEAALIVKNDIDALVNMS